MFQKIKKHLNIIYFTLFAFIWLFLLWKCRYGYGNSDESFYLATPLRILKGDKYLIDEWHLSQLSSILLLPAMKLHLMIFKSTTGIILHFRYLYTVIWGLSALYIYFMLKHVSRTGATISSIIYLIYAPFGIMALSYNSMGIMFLSLSLVTLVSKYSEKPLALAISGMFFACSVLCCPYLLIVYLLFSAITAYNVIRKTGSAIIHKWKYTTLGAVIVFIIFSLIVITPITDQIELLSYTIPYILNDPEHPSISIIRRLYLYIRAIFLSNSVSPYVLSCIILIYILRIFTKLNKDILFILTSIAVIIYQITFLITTPYINLIMFAPGLLALFCIIRSDDSKMKAVFYYIFIPGFLYSVCLSMSSNQYFYAISSASTVTAVAAFVIILLYVKKQVTETQNKKILYSIYSFALAFILLQGASELYLRYTSVFWEKSMADQTIQIDIGAEKGLLVTQEKYNYYNAIYNDTELIRQAENIDSVLFFSKQTVLYLDTDKEFATYSSWLSGLDQQSISKLGAYYSMKPERLPDIIYAPDTSEGLSAFTSIGYTEAYSGQNVYMLIRNDQ